LGILIDGAQYDNVLFTGKVRITRLDLGGFGSEWRTDFTFGSQWGIESEYYKPLARESRWFLAPRVYAQDTPFNLYDRSIQLADYRIRQYGTGVDLGYAFNRFSELRLGYEISDYRSSLRVGAPVLPTPHGRVGISSVRYNLDKLDSPIVPRQGEAVRSRVQWTDASPGAPRAFPLAELYLVGVHRTSKAGSVFVQAYGGSTFGHQDTGLPQFYLGGPGILSAYGEHELRTNQYYLLRAGYIRELANLPPLIGNKIYLISAYELGKTYGLPPSSTLSLSSRLPTDGTVALVIDTLFGPLSIGGSAGDTGHYKWYFSLGKVF
jgi:NTE family protein